MEVIDRPPSDPDWYKARNTSGQIGLVPKNYLVELSQYLTQDVGKYFKIWNILQTLVIRYQIIIFKGTISLYLIHENHLGVNGAAKTTNGNGTADMSSAGQTVSPQTLEAIKQQPWYFGHITRADCDNILTDKGQDGDFMVRESETNVSF